MGRLTSQVSKWLPQYMYNYVRVLLDIVSSFPGLIALVLSQVSSSADLWEMCADFHLASSDRVDHEKVQAN